MRPLHTIACAALLLHAAAINPYDLDWREGFTRNGVALPPCHHAENPANGFEAYYPQTGPVLVSMEPGRPWYSCIGIGQVGTHAPGEESNALKGAPETTLNIDLVDGFLTYFYADGNRFTMENGNAGLGLHLRSQNPAGTEKFLFVDFALGGDLHGRLGADPTCITLHDAKDAPVIEVHVLKALDVYQEKYPASWTLLSEGKVLRVSVETGAPHFPLTVGLLVTRVK